MSSATAAGIAPGTPARPAFPSPAELYGPLLTAVQEQGLFGDGKAFVDALPRRPVAEIMADFARVPVEAAALRAFVTVNFELPLDLDPVAPARAGVALRAYTLETRRKLPPATTDAVPGSSALAIGHPHVVPGGRFREIYYWDSFFTLLGLVRDGERALANGIVDAMTDLIERFGYVPNGTRTYYLGRSQPPVFYLMVALLGETDPAIAKRRLLAMKREHAWWMSGAAALQPGARGDHAARLADGSLVNRYWDPNAMPRDESWREDVATAAASARPAEQVYRELRAGAESGWDFSSRWLDGPCLASIRTLSIAPVDLNAFLFGLESAIAASGDDRDEQAYGRLAQDRLAAMHRHFWNEEGGYFTDYDLDLNAPRPNSSAAALTPLLVGLATQAQADATAGYVRDDYLAPGGLRTTLTATGQQWDKPNGWAPLQWIAVAGLRRYGHDHLAREIARRWVTTVNETYLRNGLVFEKYDVEASAIGAGGEYAPQTGFGWTSGVTADFLDTYGFRD
jgi:alpha,alpha-trehalase